MDLSWCVTHRFPLEAGIDAYRTFAGRAEGCLKAVIEFANGAR
jgi:threonine dehydrogenase-like Zn-dependent dehydrogenase